MNLKKNSNAPGGPAPLLVIPGITPVLSLCPLLQSSSHSFNTFFQMHTIPITTDAAATWDWPLQHHDGVVKVTNTSEKFEVGLDAGFFGPNDIDVKVNGYEIIIHLRHEDRQTEYGIVNREVHRTYKLPDDIDPATVTSHLNSSGVLTITAKKL